MSLPNHPAGQAPQTHSAAADTSLWIRGIVFVALFAALFIVSSFIKSSPGAAVPFSLQTFAIMLAGGLLGAVHGFWSIFLVVLLTAVGIPLMNGPGGLAQVFGPTGGFIWMFPVSAFLIGWAADRLFARRTRLDIPRIALLFVAMLVFGVALVYVSGVPWLAHVTGMNLSGAAKAGMLPFLAGDLIKAVAATFIVTVVRPSVPRLRPANKR